MPLEYEARAVGVSDSPDGSKVLVFATTCHRTVRIVVSRSQADFTVKELNPVEEPAA